MKTYLPKDIYENIVRRFESVPKEFAKYNKNFTPYGIQDVYNVGNFDLKKIRIPVYCVNKADEEGNYYFTLFVFDNSYDGLKSEAKRSYRLKISAEKYGLYVNDSENDFNIFKVIEVDVNDYKISLDKSETLGFFDAEDTLVPAYLPHEKTFLRYYITEKFPSILGLFTLLGNEKRDCSDSSVLMDFVFERKSEKTDAIKFDFENYETLVEKMKKKFEGKYVSILGDSISTFGGVSNNTFFNSTIGKNAVYYPEDGSRIIDSKYTYWGRIINDCNMKLCVNNGWSGFTVYGQSGITGPVRAYELDNDNRTPDNPADDINPDLIIFYMGINDMACVHYSPFGEFADTLVGVDKDKQKELIDKWFEEVKKETDDATNLEIDKTYHSLEAAYALSLYIMKRKYKDATIILPYIQGDKTKIQNDVDRRNAFIKSICDYFGVITFDQTKYGINRYTRHSVTRDLNCLHPNASGHLMLSKMIMAELTK